MSRVKAHPNWKKTRQVLVPLKKAYYVPRVDGHAILPDNWKPKEKEEVLETILPAFSVVSPERPGVTFTTFSHTAPSTSTTTSDAGPSPTTVDLKTALETLPKLDIHRVRVSDESNRIYGSVTAEDIAEQLNFRWNIIVDKTNVHVAGGRFKEVGVKQVVISISETESVTLSIHIKDFGEDGAPAPAAES
ncbi:hypothetical protein HK097_007836 [Rhizophlyctis rosea]|uniref:Large ribosomal subunit protein bL9 C-terminal domain-containing protein n=1 Tax=Rhizophlyctis rosea TaxID=64517 RepID=A0AAD5SCN3_9FUNG|nr:hypothetical protein HK097_007836 [Rhizophlyctis rosea]